MISVGVRLAAFNLKQIANLTCTDELDLYSIGEKKVALFCCIPDADTSMNYLVGMIYSNLFQTLYYVADRKYGGRLPIPVLYKSSSSVQVRFAICFRLKAARRTPTEIKIDFAVFPAACL